MADSPLHGSRRTERVIDVNTLTTAGQRVEIRMPATVEIRPVPFGARVLAGPTRAFILDDGQTITASPNLANIQVVATEIPRVEHPNYRIGWHYLRNGQPDRHLLFTAAEQFVDITNGAVWTSEQWASWAPASLTPIGRHGEAVDFDGDPYRDGSAYIEVDAAGQWSWSLGRVYLRGVDGWWDARGQFWADDSGAEGAPDGDLGKLRYIHKSDL